MTSVTQAPQSVRFGALGTYVHLGVAGDAGDLIAAEQAAHAVLARVDRAASRFRSDSDLMRANASAGRWCLVDPVLVAAVRLALEVAADTDGLVDPLLGRTLVSLGYDRDFAALHDTGVRRLHRHDPAAWQRVGVRDDAVHVPRGHALDLGATGKAYAADLVLGHLDVDAVVSVGGDVAMRGEVPWPVGIAEHPGQEPDEVVLLHRGGAATSSTAVRRWTAGGVVRHHLIDPRNGVPARSCWRTVTALGRSATAANAASTAAVVLGEDAPAWLTRRGVAARLVAHDGAVTHLGHWPVPEEEDA
ncbi:FAD:protein FMN transferase [Alteromonas gracilis]